jgi:hypothetical protein
MSDKRLLPAVNHRIVLLWSLMALHRTFAPIVRASGDHDLRFRPPEGVGRGLPVTGWSARSSGSETAFSGSRWTGRTSGTFVRFRSRGPVQVFVECGEEAYGDYRPCNSFRCSLTATVQPDLRGAGLSVPGIDQCESVA